MLKKTPAIVVIAFALVAILSGCSSVSTSSDKQALHYKDGPFSSKKFANCVAKSTRNVDGPGDRHFEYPAGERTFSFTGRKGSESDPISVKTKDSQEMSVKGFITFALTDNCDRLRKFHESVGMKYEAYESDGWDRFLNDYLAVPLNSTMDKAGLQAGWRDLYSSNDAQSAFEEFVKTNLPGEVAAALDDDVLTIKSVSIETPQPPKDLRASLEAREKAVLDNEAQKAKNTAAVTRYGKFADCKRVMSENSCLILDLAEAGNVPFYPLPAGGALNVNPSGK